MSATYYAQKMITLPSLVVNIVRRDYVMTKEKENLILDFLGFFCISTLFMKLVMRDL